MFNMIITNIVITKHILIAHMCEQTLNNYECHTVYLLSVHAAAFEPK